MSEQEKHEMTDDEFKEMMNDKEFVNALGLAVKNKFIQDNFEFVYCNTFYILRMLSEIFDILHQKGFVTEEDVKKIDAISQKQGEHKLIHALEETMANLTTKEVKKNDV